MTYTFQGTENDKGQISLVFAKSTDKTIRVEAGDFYLGKYEQDSIPPREQLKGAAELINQCVYPEDVLKFDV